MVRVEENLIIDWRYSPDSRSVLNSTAGKSENKFYVTHKTRDDESGVYSNNSPYSQSPVPHTVIAVGCEAADYMTSENPILTAITQKFSSLAIQRADDGTSLTYYDQWYTQSDNTEELLTTSDGQCGSWAKFFLDVLYAQGIKVASPDPVIGQTNPFNYYEIEFGIRVNSNGGDQTNADRIPDGFVVNNFSFDQLPQSNSSTWVKYNTPNSSFTLNEVSDYGIQLIPAQTVSGLTNRTDIYLSLFANNRLNFLMPLNQPLPMSDSNGIPGQGETENPLCLFENHQFVWMKGITYDPSYGGTYGRNVGSFINSIAAVWYSDFTTRNEVADGVDYNQNGMMETVARVVIFRFDPHPINFQLVPKASIYKGL